jgi:predicted MFS family arabinose efflux permease
VQSSFPEEKQGEISGLSRSVSNLGSSLGTAIAGTILVSELATGNKSYVLAMVSLAAISLIGLGAAILLPRDRISVKHAVSTSSDRGDVVTASPADAPMA